MCNFSYTTTVSDTRLPRSQKEAALVRSRPRLGQPARSRPLALDRPSFTEDGRDGTSFGVVVCREGVGGRGTVFNAATIEWSHGLRSSAAVQAITRNVLARLSA